MKQTKIRQNAIKDRDVDPKIYEENVETLESNIFAGIQALIEEKESEIRDKYWTGKTGGTH